MKMSRVKITFAAVLTMAVLQLPAFAQTRPDFRVLPEQTPQLLVLSATPQAGNVLLHVTGRNFCDTPLVTLADIPVSITNATSTSFDVLLPVGIQPGTYLLEVSCGKGRIFNDSFLVVIQ